MKLPKRILLISTPLLLAFFGAGLHAAPKRPVKCGQKPTLVMAIAQKLGVAAKPGACETAAQTSAGSSGEWCVNDGHPCRDADGKPGKCTSSVVLVDGIADWSCVCVPHHQ